MQVFKSHLFKWNHASELLKLEVGAETNMLQVTHQQERAKQAPQRTRYVPSKVKREHSQSNIHTYLLLILSNTSFGSFHIFNNALSLQESRGHGEHSYNKDVNLE